MIAAAPRSVNAAAPGGTLRAVSLLVRVVLVVLFSLAAAPAAACSCDEATVEEAIASAGAIFEGVVDSIEVDASGDARVVRFAVTQAWRGVASEHVEVRTSIAESACGYPFEVGQAYLVYASGTTTEGYRVSLCSRTRAMDAAGEDRIALGAGVVPVDVVDEDVEPVRPPRTAPSRAGCASCAVGAGVVGGRAVALAPAALVVLVVLRARGARRTRSTRA